MEKLIVKFEIKKNTLFSQIIKQDDSHRHYICFKSTTGLKIKSMSHPALVPWINEFFIRGSSKNYDEKISSHTFENKKSLLTYVFTLKKAINEFNQHYGAT